MRWLLFLARLAFICNLFFIACMVFRYVDVAQNQSLTSFIIVIGWMMAPIINLIFNVSYVVTFYRRRDGIKIPRWLLIFNLAMQLLELIIISIG
jgi:hypothetical protein